MKRIFKYPLSPRNTQTIEMHQGDILKVGTLRNVVFIWALVDPDLPTVKRSFAVVLTGRECKHAKAEYLGTVAVDNNTVVLHVFEVVAA